MYYIGIDPGANGGIVILNSKGYLHNVCNLNNMTRHMIKRHIQYIADLQPNTIYIEKVSGFIRDKDTGKNNVAAAHKMFEFGKVTERVLMALECYDLEFVEVLPKAWQRSFNLYKEKNETQAQFKDRMKQKARCIFNTNKVILNTADAFLIAQYCYKMNTRRHNDN